MRRSWSTLLPYTTLFRSDVAGGKTRSITSPGTGSGGRGDLPGEHGFRFFPGYYKHVIHTMSRIPYANNPNGVKRSEEHTSELQSLRHLVCRLLLEKKNNI